MLIRNVSVTLMAALACTFACVEPGEDFQSERAGADTDAEMHGEDIGSQIQAVTTTRLHTSKKIHFGGTFLEEDHYVDVGSDCSSGWTRVSPPSVTHAGHGYCEFDKWVTASNPTDCRARIHLHHSAGWLYGDCYVDIFEQYDPDSCLGICGTQAPGGCYCDSVCTSYGDCCDDYAPSCNPDSCWGSCGSRAPGGCYCDSLCTSYGDCCSDYSSICT